MHHLLHVLCFSIGWMFSMFGVDHQLAHFFRSRWRKMTRKEMSGDLQSKITALTIRRET